MGILDLFFPKACLECGKEGKYICESCLKKVRKVGFAKDKLSIFRYEGVIRKAIIALKYKYTTEVAKELADICVRNLKSTNLINKNYLLIPIPLHWHKQNVRGFNQAEEIGKLVAREMNWKYEPNLLIKKVSTKPQVGLKGSTRHENLKGVFSLSSNYSLITNRYPLILFDDVLTTGSTLSEASKTLRKAGVKRIFWLTIAK
jgi:ComF family protein